MRTGYLAPAASGGLKSKGGAQMAKTSEKYELMYIIDPTWEKRIRRARKEVQGTFEQHGTLDDWRDG